MQQSQHEAESHHHLVPRLRMGGTLSPRPYAFMAYTEQNLPLLLGTITLQDLGFPQWYL